MPVYHDLPGGRVAVGVARPRERRRVATIGASIQIGDVLLSPCLRRRCSPGWKAYGQLDGSRSSWPTTFGNHLPGVRRPGSGSGELGSQGPAHRSPRSLCCPILEAASVQLKAECQIAASVINFMDCTCHIILYFGRSYTAGNINYLSEHMSWM